MQVNDKVTVNSPAFQKLYGVKDDQSFIVKEVVNNDKVKLDNGWLIATNHLTLISDNSLSKDDFDLKKAVDEEIQYYVDEDMAFTAYDVTSALRKEYTDQDIKHYQVRKIVHEAMADYISYEKTLIDIPGSDVKSVLYYPTDYNSDSYVVGEGAQTLEYLAEDVQVEPKPEEAWEDEGGNVPDVATVSTNKSNLFVKLLKKLIGKGD